MHKSLLLYYNRTLQVGYARLEYFGNDNVNVAGLSGGCSFNKLFLKFHYLIANTSMYVYKTQMTNRNTFKANTLNKI